MAAVIHHGGGVGTYKSFSVIQNHAIPQLIKGRTVISTIRGFDSIRVIEAVLDVECHPDSKIIFVDIESIEGMEKIRRWWEWVPVGSYIIIDEAQLVYPKSKRISEYNYPARDGMTSDETALADDRPNGFLQAFTMQRHNNWDLAIIAPNIKMLVPEITQVTQVAYEHKRMGDLIPWKKHGWREIQHSPLQTANSSTYGATQFTADKRVYKCYKSTKTGEHSVSGSERSIFKNPRVISAFATIFISLSLLAYLLVFEVFGKGGSLDHSTSYQDALQANNITIASNGSVRNDAQIHSNVVDTIDQVRPIETTRFDSPIMSIVGRAFKDYIIEIGLPPDSYQLTTSQLYRNGVEIEIINECKINMMFNDQNYVVRCPLHRRYFKQEKERLTVNAQPFAAITNSVDAES